MLGGIIHHMLMYESNEYRATERWPYAISAGCVVYRQAGEGIEVLLLRRHPDHSYNHQKTESYNLPKGHVGFEETLEKAAIRETQEEAGCDVLVNSYLGPLERDFIHPKFKNHIIKTTHYFAAQWESDMKTIDHEHDERVWVMLEKAIELLSLTPKGEDEIIKRLRKMLEVTAI